MSWVNAHYVKHADDARLAALVALVTLRRQSEHAGSSWFDLLSKSELFAHDGRAQKPIFVQISSSKG